MNRPWPRSATFNKLSTRCTSLSIAWLKPAILKKCWNATAICNMNSNAKTEDFIRRNLAGQKTKQAKSRRTMLERLDRVESVRADQASGDFRLQEIERAGTHVLTIVEATIGYPDKTLATDISLILRRG